MDPLTITSTVIAISAQCIRAARALYDLRGKYQEASMTITAIYSESTVISTSLAHIQGLCTKNPDALRSTLQERSELQATFDQALTGCVLVYSVLDDEVQRLYAAIGKEGLAASVGKLKLLWKEDAMRDVLTQIRGQQTALGLLIQVLQLGSIHDIRSLLENNTTVLQKVATQTTQFRQANPRIKAPESVFELEINDVASLYSVDSGATSTNFVFDDLVVNSQAYRRAIMQLRNGQTLTTVQEQSGKRAEVAAATAATTSKNAWFEDQIKNLEEEKKELEGHHINSLAQNKKEWEASLQQANARWEMVQKEWKKSSIHRQRKLQTEIHVLVDKGLQQTNAYWQKMQKEWQMSSDHREGKLQTEIHVLLEKNEALVVLKDELLDERNRLSAEKDEIEQSRDFLAEEHQRHIEFFRKNEEKRKTLCENHDKETTTRASKLYQVEEENKELSKANEELRSKNEALSTEEQNLEAAIYSYRRTIRERDAEIKDLKASMKEKEDEEARRYKGFESIIEQVRLLSPGPPTNSSNANANAQLPEKAPTPPLPAPPAIPKLKQVEVVFDLDATGSWSDLAAQAQSRVAKPSSKRKPKGSRWKDFARQNDPVAPGPL